MGPVPCPPLFTYGDHRLRVVEIDGNPWFVAADVCRCLGLDVSRGTGAALRPLEADEKRVVRSADTPVKFTWGPGGNHSIISESGLYKLVLRAQRSNPAAAKFQDWVTREVLPAIRKDGMYVMGEEKVRTGEMSEDERSMMTRDHLGLPHGRSSPRKAFMGKGAQPRRAPYNALNPLLHITYRKTSASPLRPLLAPPKPMQAPWGRSSTAQRQAIQSCRSREDLQAPCAPPTTPHSPPSSTTAYAPGGPQRPTETPWRPSRLFDG